MWGCWGFSIAVVDLFRSKWRYEAQNWVLSPLSLAINRVEGAPFRAPHLLWHKFNVWVLVLPLCLSAFGGSVALIHSTRFQAWTLNYHLARAAMLGFDPLQRCVEFRVQGILYGLS